MFVNGIPFVFTFSRNIRLITCKHVPTCNSGQLAKYLMEIIKLCARGGFVTRLVIMDMEFEKVKYKVVLMKVNNTSAQEHVSEIESQIRLMKERTRCSTSDMLDFSIKYLRKQIVIHLV